MNKFEKQLSDLKRSPAYRNNNGMSIPEILKLVERYSETNNSWAKLLPYSGEAWILRKPTSHDDYEMQNKSRAKYRDKLIELAHELIDDLECALTKLAKDLKDQRAK